MVRSFHAFTTNFAEHTPRVSSVATAKAKASIFCHRFTQIHTDFVYIPRTHLCSSVFICGQEIWEIR
jgi:hypothetical protein